MTARAETGTLRLMTWNIHGGVGPDGRFDLDRVAAVIARHDPDILALQEIDTRGRDVNCLRPLQDLHDSNGHWTDARTITAPDGHYGHTLLTRWPVQATVLHDLSFRRHEPRCAIETMVATPQGALHLVSVHLGLRIAERRAQARRLAELAHRSRGVTTMFMGDFNDWWSWGSVRSSLRQALPARSRLATFPARLPLLRLDRIYCRGREQLLRCWTDRAAARCSDHLPVIADVRLRA